MAPVPAPQEAPPLPYAVRPAVEMVSGRGASRQIDAKIPAGPASNEKLG